MSPVKIETGYSTEQLDHTRLLIIAPPKVGKTYTTALTSAKDPKDVLMVLADEGGLRTLRTHRIPCARAKIPAKGAYRHTVDLMIQLKAKCPYKVIVIDSASMLLQKIKFEVITENNFTTSSGKEDKRRMYGMLLDRMREIVWRAHDISADIIWTAWLREPFQDRMGGAQIEGQSADAIEGNVDAILCLERVRDVKEKETGGFKYQMRTKPFYISKAAGSEVDNSGQVNCNNRLGLPDPFPANIFSALHYDVPEKAMLKRVAK